MAAACDFRVENDAIAANAGQCRLCWPGQPLDMCAEGPLSNLRIHVNFLHHLPHQVMLL
jgi:hypothetical protein